jgi:methylmalonyl-CoA decarboxylase subunit alpha
VSGLGDALVTGEHEALAFLRDWLAFFPSSWREDPVRADARPPVESPPIEMIIPERENVAFDVHKVIGAVVDADSFLEYKALFARELVTGLARLDGWPVGVLANQSMHKGGVLFSDSSDKAARFVWLCNAFNIPLLFLVDVPGFMIGSVVERQGIIRHGAKMLFAVAESRVPRIAVLVRKAYGGGYLAMSGSPMAPSAVLALPTAKPALMGPNAAVNAMHYNRIMEIDDERERLRYIAEERARYEAKVDVFHVASENSVEAVVPGSELRDELIRRYAAYRRRPTDPHDRRNGVYPV